MGLTISMIITAVLLDGLVGLSGGILPMTFVRKHITSLLAFAAGTLVASTFLDLLPSALADTTMPSAIMPITMLGFFIFYAVESFIGSHAAGQSGHKHDTIGPMILIGDALHNTTDGMAIAAAFLFDVKTGVATALAVIVHELPQEIGDYSILVSHGYSRGKALFYLVLVQCSAFIGAFGTIWAASTVRNATPYLMAIAGGGFLYIAATDLLPELKRQESGSAMTKLLAFCGGIGIISILEIFLR